MTEGGGFRSVRTFHCLPKNRYFCVKHITKHLRMVPHFQGIDTRIIIAQTRGLQLNPFPNWRWQSIKV